MFLMPLSRISLFFALTWAALASAGEADRAELRRLASEQQREYEGYLELPWVKKLNLTEKDLTLLSSFRQVELYLERHPEVDLVIDSGRMEFFQDGKSLISWAYESDVKQQNFFQLRTSGDVDQAAELLTELVLPSLHPAVRRNSRFIPALYRALLSSGRELRFSPARYDMTTGKVSSSVVAIEPDLEVEGMELLLSGAPKSKVLNESYATNMLDFRMMRDRLTTTVFEARLNTFEVEGGGKVVSFERGSHGQFTRLSGIGRDIVVEMDAPTLNGKPLSDQPFAFLVRTLQGMTRDFDALTIVREYLDEEGEVESRFALSGGECGDLLN